MALTKGQIGIVENWLKRFNPDYKCVCCNEMFIALGTCVNMKIEECTMNIAGEELTQISITCKNCGNISLFDTRKIIL
jgi:hypothetical protein